MGGGFKENQALPGKRPTPKEFGEAWDFNHQEVFHGGKGKEIHVQVQGGTPEWGPNWEEDQGGGDYRNA